MYLMNFLLTGWDCQQKGANEPVGNFVRVTVFPLGGGVIRPAVLVTPPS
jgi:hypothetical protein